MKNATIMMPKSTVEAVPSPHAHWKSFWMTKNDGDTNPSHRLWIPVGADKACGQRRTNRRHSFWFVCGHNNTDDIRNIFQGYHYGFSLPCHQGGRWEVLNTWCLLRCSGLANCRWRFGFPCGNQTVCLSFVGFRAGIMGKCYCMFKGH